MLKHLLLGSGDLQSYVINILLSLPIILLALSVHETAHGYIAYKLGDPTAHSLGRLTLNPIKHLDPIGFLSMVLFGFGWAKPVPINTRYFKKPKRDMALTGVAGPISNLLLAIVFALLMKLFELLIVHAHFPNTNVLMMAVYFQTFLYYGIYLNIALAIFNLIPVPPMDGSRLLFALLPSKLYFKIMRYEQYIYIAVIILLALGVLSPVVDFLTGSVMDLLFKLFAL
jgi:Zn-dependent protease